MLESLVHVCSAEPHATQGDNAELDHNALDEFVDVPMEVSDEDRECLRAVFPGIGEDEFDKHCKHLVSVRARDAKRKRDTKRRGPPEGSRYGLVLRHVKSKRGDDATAVASTPT